jgi:hypothetical protein
MGSVCPEIACFISKMLIVNSVDNSTERYSLAGRIRAALAGVGCQLFNQLRESEGPHLTSGRGHHLH